MPLIRNEDIRLCCGCCSGVIFLRQTRGKPWRYFPDTAGADDVMVTAVTWPERKFIGAKYEILALVKMCFLFSLLLLALQCVIVV